MVNQISSHSGGVHQGADTMPLKLCAGPYSCPHQDCWRRESTGAERDAPSFDFVWPFFTLNLDCRGAAIFYDHRIRDAC